MQDMQRTGGISGGSAIDQARYQDPRNTMSTIPKAQPVIASLNHLDNVIDSLHVEVSELRDRLSLISSPVPTNPTCGQTADGSLCEMDARIVRVATRAEVIISQIREMRQSLCI